MSSIQKGALRIVPLSWQKASWPWRIMTSPITWRCHSPSRVPDLDGTALEPSLRWTREKREPTLFFLQILASPTSATRDWTFQHTRWRLGCLLLLFLLRDIQTITGSIVCSQLKICKAKLLVLVCDLQLYATPLEQSAATTWSSPHRLGF